MTSENLSSDPTSPWLPGLAPQAPGAERVVRPIQFLGAKLRALQPIAGALGEAFPEARRVLDPFTGSGVVSQRLSDLGYGVLAADAMSFCAMMARATLGVARPSGSHAALRHALDEALAPTSPHGERLEALWGETLDAEARALATRDSEALMALYEALPQVWRPQGASPALLAHLQGFAPGSSALETGGLVTAHYAGTYFGVRQAVTLDAARCHLEGLAAQGSLTTWERDVLLTALLGAASRVVYSAGKHFAQPHRLSQDKSLEFHQRRLLTDRRMEVADEARAALVELIGRPRPRVGAEVLHAPLEALCQDPQRCGDIDVVYADPPYTAQQYSRFYHIPEVLVGYHTPALMRRDGEVTRGLYPEVRHKSRFCSRRQAPEAFADLVGLAAGLGAGLLISYSGTEGELTGNARMVSLPALEALCRARYAEVEVQRLDHAYRQFNAEDFALERRQDAEFLIVCKAPC